MGADCYIITGIRGSILINDKIEYIDIFIKRDNSDSNNDESIQNQIDIYYK